MPLKSHSRGLFLSLQRKLVHHALWWHELFLGPSARDSIKPPGLSFSYSSTPSVLSLFFDEWVTFHLSDNKLDLFCLFSVCIEENLHLSFLSKFFIVVPIFPCLWLNFNHIYGYPLFDFSFWWCTVATCSISYEPKLLSCTSFIRSNG